MPRTKHRTWHSAPSTKHGHAGQRVAAGLWPRDRGGPERPPPLGPLEIRSPLRDGFLDVAAREVFANRAVDQSGQLGVGREAQADELRDGELRNLRVL